jgi:FtsP/CotA-like multicopper oxidase with cupredoxin domain
MNPQFRKVALIAAALGLLLSLFIALRPDDDGGTAVPTATVATTTQSQQSPTTEPPATTAPTGPVRFSITAGGEIERGTVKVGRDVVITVTAGVSDEVHLHGYDLSDDVAPGEQAEIEFEATVPGQFEVELESRHQLIGVLEVGA